ncbi:MAG: class I SAM-dependent methyltransferase, partial [Terriglobia bacterium]
MGDSNVDSRDFEPEIERSRIEAQSVTDGDLVLTPANLKKYRNVTGDAAAPLRYAYYLLGDAEGKAVMDYGRGSGENSVILSTLGAKVTGIDISPELIDLSKRRMEIAGLHWKARVGSAYATGEPDGSFDVVFGAAILHHLDIED